MGVLTEPLAPIFTGLNDGWPCGLLTKGFAIRLEVAAEPLLPDSYNGFIRKHCSNSTDLKNTSVVHSTPSSCIGVFCEVWSLFFQCHRNLSSVQAVTWCYTDRLIITNCDPPAQNQS